MPLTIRLEGETGDVLDEFVDLHGSLVSLSEGGVAKGLEIAHTIDPYGDTVLNTLQVPLLLRDIERIRESTQLSDLEDFTLRLLARLASKSQSTQHVYLKFYGD